MTQAKTKILKIKTKQSGRFSIFGIIEQEELARLWNEKMNKRRQSMARNIEWHDFISNLMIEREDLYLRIKEFGQTHELEVSDLFEEELSEYGGGNFSASRKGPKYYVRNFR